MNKIVKFNKVNLSCMTCSLSEMCLPHGLTKEDLKEFDESIKHERLLNKDEVLFELDQPFKSLYAIRSGLVKVYIPTNDGDAQVLRFHMPGELLGLDALGHNIHSCTAVALETTNICELPYHRLHDLCNHMTDLNDHFIAMMSNELAEEHEMMLMLGRKSAEARVAVFLLNMSARFRVHGFSRNQFNLNITRHDIGNYLGLAEETISRILTHMHKEKIVEINRRDFHILDMPHLRSLAELDEIETTYPQSEKYMD